MPASVASAADRDASRVNCGGVRQSPSCRYDRRHVARRSAGDAGALVAEVASDYENNEAGAAQVSGACVVAEAFRVDPEALADTVQQMAQFQRYAENMLGQIDSLVGRLNATWTGQGAAAHAEAHRHSARDEAMMRAALAQLTTAGATAHGNYTGVMSTNLSMWT
jgi:uncharacterized protein YukE